MSKKSDSDFFYERRGMFRARSKDGANLDFKKNAVNRLLETAAVQSLKNLPARDYWIVPFWQATSADARAGNMTKTAALELPE